MLRNYYGGLPSQGTPSGRIHRLKSASSFAELVAGYFDIGCSVSMTRQAFLDSPKARRDQVKSVAYVTACSFKEGVFERNNDNADELQLVFFDIDSGEFSKQMFAAPQVVADQLDTLNFVLYTTANHTPENPRLRLMVDIEPCPLEMHHRAVAHVAALLGISAAWEGFRESHVISQPMYRPVLFDGDPGSPILCSRTSGRALTAAELPETTLKKAPARYRAEFADDWEDDLEFMPLSITLEEVRGALFTITADCGYEQWTHVAAALRHQFREEDEARQAFELFDEWSQTGVVSYRDAEDTLAKWRSFRPCPAGRAPLTVRSLLKLALDAGWDNTAVAQRSVDEFQAWLDGCKSGPNLLSEFPAQVARVPFPSEPQDDALCDKACRAYNKLTGSKTKTASFKKSLREFREKVVRDDPDDKPAWMRPIVFVASSNTFWSTSAKTHFTPQAFDRMFSHHLMPIQIEVGGNAKPIALPGDYALNVKQIPKVIDSIYDPRQAGSEPIFMRNGVQFLNTYQASYPEPDAATSAEAGRILRAHIAHLIEEPEYRHIQLDWCAFLIQFPGVKVRWAPLIQSIQGAGKGLFAKALEGALGRGNVKPVSNNIISSQWNDWACGAQLIVIEEIHVSGQNGKAVMDGLKELMTNDELPVNKRLTSAYVVDNLVNVICFTNEHDALRTSARERRYFVLKSPLRHREQVDAIHASGHVARMVRLQAGKDLSAGLRHYLLNHKISSAFDPNGNAPVTKYQAQMSGDAENPAVSRIRELIEADDNWDICAKVISRKGLTEQLGREAGRVNPARWLRQLDYVEHGGVRRVGPGRSNMTQLWVHRDHDDLMDGDPADILLERHARLSGEEMI